MSILHRKCDQCGKRKSGTRKITFRLPGGKGETHRMLCTGCREPRGKK